MIAPTPIATDTRPTWLPENEFPFRSRFIDLASNRIHYIDEGSGPNLLFVHAGPAWLFVYRDVITRLSGDFRCVALDFPDTGLSRAAEGYRPGLAAASDVLEAFVRALDLQDITLVVHDLGGPIAFTVASRLPERVRAIAVTESFAWPLSEENPKVARMLRFVGSPPFRFLNDATNLLARGMTTSMGLGRHLTPDSKNAFRGPYRDRRVRRTATAMLRDAAIATDFMRDVERAVRNELSDRPLLLAFGAKSPTIKEGFLDRWTSWFPDAPVLVVDNAHHFPMMDDPDAVAGAIRDWWHESVAPRMAN